jgi:hypothetical protein
MAVSKPRNRIFLIRLTQEEYDALRAVSVDQGARTVSDYARTMLLTAVEKSKSAGGESLAEVCRTLTGLQETVGRMAERIDEMSQSQAPIREAKKA